MRASRMATVAGMALLAALAACRRSDVRELSVAVPGMDDARAVRIVTNAALDEVVGRISGPRHDCEIDLHSGLVLYHEGARLRDPAYLRRIEASLRQVGYEARALSVRLNPPPPVQSVDGPVQLWPDRHTAVLRVGGLDSRRAANIVVDAIAYARLGGDSAWVQADGRARILRVRYEGIRVAPTNIENAVAGVGYAANGVPALLGAADARPNGWDPVRLEGPGEI